MIEQAVYNALSNLAQRYIPRGRHKLLHVDNREAWIEIMTELLERGMVAKKLSILTKCAIGWEILITQKISIQN